MLSRIKLFFFSLLFISKFSCFQTKKAKSQKKKNLLLKYLKKYFKLTLLIKKSKNKNGIFISYSAEELSTTGQERKNDRWRNERRTFFPVLLFRPFLFSNNKSSFRSFLTNFHPFIFRFINEVASLTIFFLPTTKRSKWLVTVVGSDSNHPLKQQNKIKNRKKICQIICKIFFTGKSYKLKMFESKTVFSFFFLHELYFLNFFFFFAKKPYFCFFSFFFFNSKEQKIQLFKARRCSSFDTAFKLQKKKRIKNDKRKTNEQIYWKKNFIHSTPVDVDRTIVKRKENNH